MKINKEEMENFKTKLLLKIFEEILRNEELFKASPLLYFFSNKIVFSNFKIKYRSYWSSKYLSNVYSVEIFFKNKPITKFFVYEKLLDGTYEAVIKNFETENFFYVSLAYDELIKVNDEEEMKEQEKLELSLEIIKKFKEL